MRPTDRLNELTNLTLIKLKIIKIYRNVSDPPQSLNLTLDYLSLVLQLSPQVHAANLLVTASNIIYIIISYSRSKNILTDIFADFTSVP